MVNTLAKVIRIKKMQAACPEPQEQQLIPGEQETYFRQRSSTADGTREVVVRYGEIPGLPEKQKALMQKMDVNGDGEVNMEEVTQMAQQRSFLDWLVSIITIGFGVSIAVFFGLAMAGAIISQTTDIKKGDLVAPGGTQIIATRDAMTSMELTLSPVCSVEQFGQIKELTVSNMFDSETGQRCDTCPRTMMFKVGTASKYGDTKATFVATNKPTDVQVTVDKGVITLKGVPGQDPAKVFGACGALECSAVKTTGIDGNALRARAKALGFQNTEQGSLALGGHGRRDPMNKGRRLLLDGMKKAQLMFGGGCAALMVGGALTKKAKHGKKAADSKSATP